MADHFTPGPWRATYDENTGVEEVWSDEGLVAEVRWTRCYPDVPGARVNEEANCNLISAAPRLYTCLKEAVEMRCSECKYLGEAITGRDSCMQMDGVCKAQKWRDVVEWVELHVS